MSELDGSIPDHELETAIADLEELVDRSPVLSVAAIHVLKNELGDVSQLSHRRLLQSQRFVLPAAPSKPWWRSPRRALSDVVAWLRGRDQERFRDRCDSHFWRDVVPELEENFGSVAEPLMNTVNEAIINYAEYSFGRWSLGRKVAAHLFHTEDDLGYAIIRPLGTHLRIFDPLSLKEKSAETLEESKRGWGHTILMRRALFISFDKAPTSRGMMIVVGAGDL